MTVSFLTMMGKTPGHCEPVSPDGGSAGCELVPSIPVGELRPSDSDCEERIQYHRNVIKYHQAVIDRLISERKAK